jgi:hypothetical protein
MQVGPDGVLYVVDYANDPMARAVNPTGKTSGDDGVYFEKVSKSWPSGRDAWGLWLTPGSNQLWTIAWDPTDPEEPDEIWEYTDDVTTPALTAPEDGASSLRIDEVTLKWGEVENATKYHIFVSDDPGFPYYDHFAPTVETQRITGLEDGRTYYWKVAVHEGKPCLSLWSDVWSFTTALSAAQWNPFVGGIPEAPYNGATNVPLTPTFAWNAADWATGYEFVLAKDSAFTDAVVSKTGANALETTVYECEETLSTSTTYYWKVRAISSTSQSEWATAVFTTVGPPPPTPKPPTPAPEPEPPTTPAYIWVIIGIGAALVIVVIILIITTRRVTQ